MFKKRKAAKALAQRDKEWKSLVRAITDPKGVSPRAMRFGSRATSASLSPQTRVHRRPRALRQRAIGLPPGLRKNAVGLAPATLHRHVDRRHFFVICVKIAVSPTRSDTSPLSEASHRTPAPDPAVDSESPAAPTNVSVIKVLGKSTLAQDGA